MDVRTLIRQAAERYGVNPEALVRIGQIESGLRPGAKNPTSTASGIFQFIDSTWKQYGRGADPFDAAANIDAGARFARDVTNSLRRSLGRDPEPWELYMGHQQGPGGAAAILSSNPSTRVVDALSRVYRTPTGARAAVRGNIPARSGIDPDTVTVAQWRELWSSKFNRQPVSRGSSRTSARTPDTDRIDSTLQSSSSAPRNEQFDTRAAEDQMLSGDALDAAVRAHAADMERRRASTETLRSLAEQEERRAQTCPPGMVFDPALGACVPYRQDDAPRFADPRLAEQAQMSDPLRRFDVVLDALPGKISRIR
jgi:hypothetical protein